MKLLLVHPEDDPEKGPWTHGPWDQVLDAGFAGQNTYDRWSEFFRCPASPLQKLGLEDVRCVRQTLFSRLGCVVDQHGLDWWELLSIEFHERIERILSLKKLAAQLGASDEVFLSRCGFHGRVMELLLARKVKSLRPARPAVARLRRVAGAASKLRFGQLLQILGDKYDTGYKMRRFVARRRKACERPVVLLPTAYVNVSRTGLSYATALPDRDFLLVATRQSGWIPNPPKNVRAAHLASYAPGKCNEDEYQYLLKRWRQLLAEMGENQELSILTRLGAFECVPSLLQKGLAIRDAWLRVFESEPVSAVLCADDSNPYTRVPLLLARERGLPAIACHHGALDGRYLIKRNYADAILVKGRMEQDYLVRVCGVPEQKVEIGAPSSRDSSQPIAGQRKDLIVFFSEVYELAGGRCGEFYSDVLPRLAEIASATNRELVVKLHPAESLRERRRLAKAALSPLQWKNTRIVEGPLSEELLVRIWCAVTVLSTTAVDCSLRGIPVFLCTWLGYLNYKYVEQFIKFGAGTGLRSADEILKIQDMVQDFCPKSTRDLWEAASAAQLDRLLSEQLKVAAAV